MNLKIRIFILFAFAMALQCYAKNSLTPYQKAAIATRFASEVKYNFAGYDRFAHNYDSLCRAELSFRRIGQKLISLLQRHEMA